MSNFHLTMVLTFLDHIKFLIIFWKFKLTFQFHNIEIFWKIFVQFEIVLQYTIFSIAMIAIYSQLGVFNKMIFKLQFSSNFQFYCIWGHCLLQQLFNCFILVYKISTSEIWFWINSAPKILLISIVIARKIWRLKSYHLHSNILIILRISSEHSKEDLTFLPQLMM